MEYLAKALIKVSSGETIHTIERMELMELGLVEFKDSEKELELTEDGAKYMLYISSPDFASKRY
jgi:hypothetical protein